MNERHLTFGQLQFRVRLQVLHYGLSQGQLGPMVFLWALGLASLVILTITGLLSRIGNSTIGGLALVWTIAVIVLSYGMVRSYLGNRQVYEQLLRSALESHCLDQESRDGNLWNSALIQRGKDIIVQSALAVKEMDQNRDTRPELRSAFDDAWHIFWLQYSLAKHAEEFHQNLRRITSGYPVDPHLTVTDPEVTMAVGNAEENPGLLQELVAQAHSRTGEVADQLETFLSALLTLKEMDYYPYQIATKELAQETASVLARIQARVG